LEVPEDWSNILTGANKDSSSWYLNAFGAFFTLDLVKDSEVDFDLSATKLRENMFKGGNNWEYKTPPETIDFLDRFQRTETFKSLVEEYKFVEAYKARWSSSPYPPVFVTTDCVVIQSGHVLVVTRDAYPGKGLWALPGGFINENEKIIDSAIRELVEETSIELSRAQLYGSIRAREVFDNPNRSTRGRTITHAFLLKLDDTKPLPKTKAQKGETSQVRWLPIAVALMQSEKWYEDHHAILETMIGRINV
jgi:bifunctional NMN adenylyltransferase/nudix hydrolase